MRNTVSSCLAVWPRSPRSGARRRRIGRVCACARCRTQRAMAASGLARSRLPLAPPRGAAAAAADCPARTTTEPLPTPSTHRRVRTVDPPRDATLPLPTPLRRCAAAACLVLVRTWAAPRRRPALMALWPCCTPTCLRVRACGLAALSCKWVSRCHLKSGRPRPAKVWTSQTHSRAPSLSPSVFCRRQVASR